MFRKISVAVFSVLLVALGWLTIAPPDLIRVGANYAAKMICSNVVLAGRDPKEVLENDVQAPGHPLLKLIRFSIDQRGEMTVVRTGLFGFIGKGLAFGNEARGCTVVPDPRMLGFAGATEGFKPPTKNLNQGQWPQGNDVEPGDNLELEAVLNDATLTGPGMRAIVVVKDGKIIGERYGAGFDETTRLMGWSMAKTVTAALVGVASRKGLLNIDDRAQFEGWDGDARRAIRLNDLMSMSSDLTWNEGYGSVSDVTRMLYLEGDMAAFVATKPIDDATPEPTGDVFAYSSGSSMLVSRILQNAIGDAKAASAFPSDVLFEPLSMDSAVMETDASGTLTGSSYMYATARDWARFGQLLLQRGAWNGRSLLPSGYVDWMSEEHPASGGEYGRGSVWLAPPGEHRPEARVSDLPEGTLWLGGHDGQSIAVIPSEGIVVVRLGLTPKNQQYKPGLLSQSIVQALR
ncbi:MAG: serine hydrolase [Ahrensia sp.]|nr:serine hydrolase [Ahrensia sp.]